MNDLQGAEVLVRLNHRVTVHDLYVVQQKVEAVGVGLVGRLLILHVLAAFAKIGQTVVATAAHARCSAQ